MADCAEEPMRAAERKVLVGGQEARLPQELEECPLWRASRRMQRTQTGAPGSASEATPSTPEGTQSRAAGYDRSGGRTARRTSCALRLGVVAHARASGEAWLVDRDSECMVLVRVVRASRVKREDVKGIGIRDAIRDGGREVIGRIEDKPSALRGKHLQPQVAGSHPLRKRYAFQEFLVVKRSRSARIRHTQRVDTIEGDAGLPKARRDRDD